MQLYQVASVEDLVIHKLVAGRPRDIEDVRGVLARRPAVDEHYLTLWLSSFRDAVQRDLLSDYLELKKEWNEGAPGTNEP